MDSQELFRDGEKSVLSQPRDQLRTHRKRRQFLHGVILVLLVSAWWYSDSIMSLVWPSPQRRLTEKAIERDVDFADIVPSEKLVWHPCFASNFCARLTVSMDYHRPLNESKDNPKVHIALLMVPGKHPIWEKQSKSPLLINPGGPGGAGTMAALAFGPYIQKVVGESQDIIGFDPRGIGATTPRADCFSYPAPGTQDEDQARGLFHRLMWQLQGTEIGLVNSSSDSLAKLDTRARALAKLCENKDELHGKDSILRYVHTPSVARDMLSIIDAWDEWTETQRVESCHPVPEEMKLSEDPKDDSKALDTKGKLVYWGFSYGTLLGATFAAMFPDRVGRVVLDGVVHADHYVEPVWEDSIQDADTIFNSFSTYCHKAEGQCAMYRDGDKPEDITKRFESVMDRIKKTPLMFANKNSNMPLIITHSDLKRLIFGTLYSPTGLWNIIATIFDALSRGQDSVLDSGIVPELPLLCQDLLPYWAYPTDAQDAIMCSDKRYTLNETIPNLQDRFDRISNYSSFADVWMTVMIGCDSWGVSPVDPPMRWDDHPAHKRKPINTSFPVLFVSNTYDPVTPLSAGIAMAKKFVNAGIVEQKSEGHCSLSAVSKCTINKLRGYFLLGQVPPHPSKTGHTICEADEWPFHPYRGNPFEAESEEARAETERMIAFQEMQTISLHMMEFWGQKSMKLPMHMIAERQPKEALPRLL
ncbi:alpha/beta-hydrolase [Mollisia scopiformis]|uniref:Alpha/beta-hydrolase n=1 Tax=Mollisia scopiformis TaxID=149040 RepID=A0A194XNQ6_MOLSC|nr:alpha/beta-hydrolase [Mollisia scopiformis]KUJ21744.1 alpha/beta-hydrolase [Mollisia scopiformis]